MTFPNITIAKDTWVDLYAESGIAAGTPIRIQNLTSSYIRLNYSTTKPTDQSSFNHLQSSKFMANQQGDGAWVFSPVTDSLVAVSEV